jgi:hypothetical protein
MILNVLEFQRFFLYNFEVFLLKKTKKPSKNQKFLKNCLKNHQKMFFSIRSRGTSDKNQSNSTFLS